MSSKDRDVVLKLSQDDARYLYAILHISGFLEKREIPEETRADQTEIYTSLGRVLKRLRKARAKAFG